MTAKIRIAVEGEVDESVARRLIECAQGEPAECYGKNGKHALVERLNGYNRAAIHGPWLVLMDLNTAAQCAPAFVRRVLPDPAPYMCLRIAVRTVEAWLLADKTNIASYLQVQESLIPSHPELLTDPKQVLVNLARRSRSRGVREDIAPPRHWSAKVGPAYVSRMKEFVERFWNPLSARQNAPSLDRAIRCLVRLIRTLRS